MATKPDEDSDLSGEYARDKHRGGYGADYARHSEEPGPAVRGDNYGTADKDDVEDQDSIHIGKATE